MTADIINLKRARKAKARADKAEAAARNRAVSGQSKADRAAAAEDTRRLNATLDGAQRMSAANEGSFPSTSQHSDDDLDPGSVS